MPGKVSSQELKRRVHILQDLGRKKKQAFQAVLLGQCVEVLAETQIENGWWQGTSENYQRVVFPTSAAFQQGLVTRVRLLEITGTGLLGKSVAIPLQK
jgi:tRNA A37 methylthiotransferase MiaB